MPHNVEGDSAAQTLLDSGKSLDERLHALDVVLSGSPDQAKVVLLEVGNRADDSDKILKAVGSALAMLSYSRTPVTAFDLRDLSRTAYDAFCEWLPPKG